MIAGCVGSGGPTPSPIVKVVTWTWAPGTCAETFHLYEVVDGQRRRLTSTVIPSYQQRMVVRKSEWVVSGMCADGNEAVSQSAQLQ